MRYSLHHIISHVRTLLNYCPDCKPLIDVCDEPTLSINRMIATMLPTAARRVLLNASVTAIDTLRPLTGEVAWKTWPGGAIAFIPLPDDFLRLASIQMTGWQRPAQIITEESPEYEWQSSRFIGVRGNPQRPVAAIVRYPFGQVVELYSCADVTQTTIKRALYVPLPEVDADGYIDLPKGLFHDIADYTANLTRQIITENP